MNRTLASGPIVWLGIIVTTCLLLVLFQTVLWLVLPVLVAVVAYYMLSPLVNIAVARGITRPRAVFIVTILLTVFLAGLGLSVEPKVSAIAHNLPKKITEYSQVGMRLINNANKTLDAYFPFLHPKQPAPNPAPATPNNLGFVSSDVVPTPPPTTQAAPVDDMQNEVADWQAKHSGDVAMELVHWIPSLLLVPYITYFFLLDGPRFKRFLVQAIPNAFFEKTLYLFYRVEDQLRRYFQGLLALTALDATCLGIGLWFLGLNAPFFLAILAAVMAWLPYLGSIGGCLLVALVAAHDFPDAHLLPYEVVGLFVAVRLLDDFVFMPLTVGRSLHMHPLITVLMILLGGAVAGISGLLLVMPVLGVVMVAGQIIGELITDQRILARHRHARHLQRQRARADLFMEG
ncbi:MAG: AI-2E family transporter [Methylacidiphilales bacterium]|nr:AI-2E family transporter [Candidatus Methylacidiphilales bacterium]